MAFFPSLKHNFIAYRSSKVSSRPDCIFEIHQLWQSDFSRVYSNCSCSCSFEAEIIKIGQSSYKMYSNNILNFQKSTTILNAYTKKVWKLIECTTYIMLFDNFLVSNYLLYFKYQIIPNSWFIIGFCAVFLKLSILNLLLPYFCSLEIKLYISLLLIGQEVTTESNWQRPLSTPPKYIYIKKITMYLKKLQFIYFR